MHCIVTYASPWKAKAYNGGTRTLTYWPNDGAFGPSIDLTYPPVWKLQYTSASTNVMHAWQCVFIFALSGGGSLIL